MLKIIINGSHATDALRAELYNYNNVIEMANKDVTDMSYEISFKLYIEGDLATSGKITPTSSNFSTAEWFETEKNGELEFTITKSDSNS